MRVEWFGQSAFSLTGVDSKVFVDPFTDMSHLARDRGMKWDYPAIEQDGVDLLLITHEHTDHNGTDAISGEPTTLRATAGRHESPIGEVIGIASEHDESAGTERGPNTIFVFDLDGTRVAHLGDFGQRELRPEQAAALEGIDLLFLPVGGGPTIGGSAAGEIVEALRPRWVVPMHYRTPRIGFLDTEEAFLAGMSRVERLSESGFDLTQIPSDGEPIAVVPAAP
jgi:L-ascorbate metabolism protein UlaG (beta-lactamase superfamily)